MSSRRGRAAAVAVAVVVGGVIAATALAADLSATADAFAPVRLAYELITNEFPARVSVPELVAGAIRGMVATLHDAHTEYLAPEAVQAFTGSLAGGFAGIGAELERKAEGPTIIGMEPASPAEAAGLRVGDVIVRVNGAVVVMDTPAQVAAVVRGPAGTPVELMIQRGERAFTVTVVRQHFWSGSVVGELLDRGRIGYIRVSDFNADSAPAFGDTYGRFLGIPDLKGIILDLRGNPGGYLRAGLNVAETLVPHGPVAYFVVKDGEKTTVDAVDHRPGPPVAVLVDGQTASAAEIVAGAVQDAHVGILVGSRTYGKGTMQTLFPLGDGSALKLTTAHWLTAGGRSIDGVGLTPDVPVKMPTGAHSGDPVLVKAESLLDAGRVP